MPKAKIKVHCIGVIDRCTVPQAVLVADIRIGRESARYVLLDDETRSALSQLRRARDAALMSYGDLIRSRNGRDAFPETIRTHAFDSAGFQPDASPLRTCQGIWSNGEPLWVRADLAEFVLDDLDAWRKCNPLRNKTTIHAPNWLVLIGAQVLALAVNLPVPQANGTGFDGSEVAHAL